jgi:hypothetical protein
MHERARLETLLTSLAASPRTLRRDNCGDWHIKGRQGHVYADARGFLIVVQTDASSRRWTFIKRRLSFCRVTQDGEDDGTLHLNRLPTPDEAGRIREAIDLKRRRHLSPEATAALVERLRPTGGPQIDPSIRQNAPAVPMQPPAA